MPDNGDGNVRDWDIDVQVSHSTLVRLATHLNGTMYNYTWSTADGDGGHGYHHNANGDDGSHYHHGSTNRSGSYLLDVNPFSAERTRGDGLNIIDARWIDQRSGLFIDITGLSETEPVTAPGLLRCKNDHRYRPADIYPLRHSTLEGVPVKVPHKAEHILVEEYERKALEVTEFHGYA